eukprot:jgi/Tetstr1/439767/TSEL_028181.t2
MLRLIAQRVAQAAPRCTAASGWHMGRSFGEVGASTAGSRNAATQGSSATSKVISSLVVERLPWITPEPKDYEVAYQEWQATLVSKYKILPEEFTDVDKSTATEDGDQETEVDSWEPASRTTEADETGDVRTTWRKLDRRLFLLVKNKSTQEWGFPSVENEEGETLRDTAERNMKALAGEEVKCYFVGNAPMGHLPLSSGGAQFFNKVQIMQDDFALEPSSGADDRIWVTKEEIADYIKDTDLCELTSRMLGE